MSYLPLNGPRVIGAVRSALSGSDSVSGYLPTRAPSTQMIRYHLSGGTEANTDGDSADGTNGATKSAVPSVDSGTLNRPNQRATDLSQGHGNRDPRPTDPLLAALRDLSSVGGFF